MAVEISYTFFINGDRYALLSMAGGTLMSPEQFGMEPTALSMACAGGFCAAYDLTPAGLYLRGLNFNGENGHHLPIGGSDPTSDIDQAAYDGPNLLIPFTGKIRLAKDFINQPRINVAYQKALAFKSVFDVTLKNGHIAGVRDRSWEMEQKRDALKNCYRSPGKLEKILYAFSLDLELE